MQDIADSFQRLALKTSTTLSLENDKVKRIGKQLNSGKRPSTADIVDGVAYALAKCDLGSEDYSPHYQLLYSM